MGEGDELVDGPTREGGPLEREGDQLLVGQCDRPTPDGMMANKQAEQLPSEPAPSRVALRGALQGLNGSTGSCNSSTVVDRAADEDSEGGTSPLLRTVASGRGYSVKYRGGDRVCEGGAIEMSSGQRTIEVGADESAHHYI